MWKLILGIIFLVIFLLMGFTQGSWPVQLWWLALGIIFLVWYSRSKK